MSYYPTAKLQENGGVLLEGEDHVVFIPDGWVEGSTAVTAQGGYHHRITLTVFVEDLHIESGASFKPGVIE